MNSLVCNKKNKNNSIALSNSCTYIGGRFPMRVDINNCSPQQHRKSQNKRETRHGHIANHKTSTGCTTSTSQSSKRAGATPATSQITKRAGAAPQSHRKSQNEQEPQHGHNANHKTSTSCISTTSDITKRARVSPWHHRPSQNRQEIHYSHA